MRGQMGADRQKVSAFYAKRGASRDSVAESVLAALARPRSVLASPRAQVLPGYCRQRLLPRLVQQFAHNFAKIVAWG